MATKPNPRRDFRIELEKNIAWDQRRKQIREEAAARAEQIRKDQEEKK